MAPGSVGGKGCGLATMLVRVLVKVLPGSRNSQRCGIENAVN
jgi:hypothetical protein